MVRCERTLQWLADPAAAGGLEARLRAAGLGAELTRQFNLGFRDLADALEPPVVDTWLVDRRLDPAAVDALASLGVTTLLVPPAAIDGEVPALPARLRGATVYCAPSLRGESFGVVLLEGKGHRMAIRSGQWIGKASGRSESRAIAVVMPPFLLHAGGLIGPEATVTLFFVLSLAVLYYRWFIARTALDTTAATADRSWTRTPARGAASRRAAARSRLSTWWSPGKRSAPRNPGEISGSIRSADSRSSQSTVSPASDCQA